MTIETYRNDIQPFCHLFIICNKTIYSKQFVRCNNNNNDKTETENIILGIQTSFSLQFICHCSGIIIVQ